MEEKKLLTEDRVSEQSIEKPACKGKCTATLIVGRTYAPLPYGRRFPITMPCPNQCHLRVDHDGPCRCGHIDHRRIYRRPDLG